MYPWRKNGTGIAAGDAAMIIDPNQFTMADMFNRKVTQQQQLGNGTWVLATKPVSKTEMAK